MNFCFLRHGVATLAAFAVAVCAAAPAAFAQSPTLAELAKKEQVRRKTTPPPPKVYTNKDLPPPPAPAQGQTPAAAQDPGAAPAGAAAPGQTPPAEQKPQPEGPVRDEAWWRTQMAQLRDELSKNEMFLEALQARVNALATNFVSRDDPAQRAKISEDRQKTLQMLDRVKADIDKTKKAVADLEEEARKAGVPPGWLR